MPADYPRTLLLVEDDPGHARLIVRHLRQAHVPYAIVHLPDGQAAVDYLWPAPAEEGMRPALPCLVLLDLNLPGCRGSAVLARLKTDPRTKHIPVIMLTTTDEPQEIEQCYALGCNAYLTKFIAYDQFVATLRTLAWLLTTIAVPTGASASC
jgi:CheY-like chemotaxis protein